MTTQKQPPFPIAGGEYAYDTNTDTFRQVNKPTHPPRPKSERPAKPKHDDKPAAEPAAPKA